MYSNGGFCTTCCTLFCKLGAVLRKASSKLDLISWMQFLIIMRKRKSVLGLEIVHSLENCPCFRVCFQFHCN